MTRIRRDPPFRRTLLREGVDLLLCGDVESGKALLRDYIKATCGFAALAEETGIPVKSLMRMFGPSGNPQVKNLFLVVASLQRYEGVRLKVRVAAAA
jgi:DNA-binding phage protein